MTQEASSPARKSEDEDQDDEKDSLDSDGGGTDGRLDDSGIGQWTPWSGSPRRIRLFATLLWRLRLSRLSPPRQHGGRARRRAARVRSDRDARRAEQQPRLLWPELWLFQPALRL